MEQSLKSAPVPSDISVQVIGNAKILGKKVN